MTAAAADGVDAVYMLMFPGWETELQSNRWHFASRWARRVPVVLVQPVHHATGPLPSSRVEPRIPNCRILSIPASVRAYGYREAVERQVRAVTADMRVAGVSHPLLWLYNPEFAGLYAGLPGAVRLLHATENYFHFNDATEFFLSLLRFALRISDVVVAVSEGVAASIRGEVPGVEPRVVTNGCDFSLYSDATTRDRALAELRCSFKAVAVYAGNINRRLDFPLIERCATEVPDTLLAFYGPVVGLGWRDSRRWRSLLARDNVRHFGLVPAQELPRIYAAADLGIIPYGKERYLVENGFPLKVLEMGAGGLPVVTTYMKPLVGLAAAIIVCGDADAFVRALAKTSRARLDRAELTELRAVCARNDYDRKFAEVAELVRARAGAEVRRLDATDTVPAGGGMRDFLSAAGMRLPSALHSWMPRGAKRRLKNWLER